MSELSTVKGSPLVEIDCVYAEEKFKMNRKNKKCVYWVICTKFDSICVPNKCLLTDPTKRSINENN